VVRFLDFVYREFILNIGASGLGMVKKPDPSYFTDFCTKDIFCEMAILPPALSCSGTI
jgi:hypothetical protein